MDELRSPGPEYSDLDLDFATSDPRVKPVVAALLRLGTDLQHDHDMERTRADDAERRLAEANHELNRLRHQMEALRNGVQDYLQETDRARSALLAVTRYALGIAPLPPPLRAVGDTAERQPNGHVPGRWQTASTPSERSVAATEDNEESASDHGSNDGPRADETSLFRVEDAESSKPAFTLLGAGGGIDGRDETTDDHRIIDDRNRLDLERLDARSYVHAFRAGRATS